MDLGNNNNNLHKMGDYINKYSLTHRIVLCNHIYIYIYIYIFMLVIINLTYFIKDNLTHIGLR